MGSFEYLLLLAMILLLLRVVLKADITSLESITSRQGDWPIRILFAATLLIGGLLVMEVVLRGGF